MNTRRAYSLLEAMMVVILLGILAAITVPRFAGAATEARTSSTHAILGGVRTALAAYRAEAIIVGDDPFPTIALLTTEGEVLRELPPANPFTGVEGIQTVTEAQADARAVVAPSAAGWNYFADNTADPPRAVFYANTDTPTSETDQDGLTLTANEL